MNRSRSNRWGKLVRSGLAVGLLGMVPLAALSATWEEDFASSPEGRGWNRTGTGHLFGWDSMREVLQVTWDSSEPNSYFFRPLGTMVSQQQDFSFRFELLLEEIAIGVDPAKPFTFQLAIGLIHLPDATSPNFFRGAGIHPVYGPRNLVELDYFPDSGFGATVAPTVVSTNNRLVFSDNHPLVLTPGERFEMVLTYTAADRILRTQAWREGEPFGLPPAHALADLVLDGFPDFRVNAFAVCSYSDDHQPTAEFAGSLRARGLIDNLRITVPDPPVQQLVGGMQDGRWRVAFQAQAGWRYTLERTAQFDIWEAVASDQAAAAGPMMLSDEGGSLAESGFYRVRAELP